MALGATIEEVGSESFRRWEVWVEGTDAECDNICALVAVYDNKRLATKHKVKLDAALKRLSPEESK